MMNMNLNLTKQQQDMVLMLLVMVVFFMMYKRRQHNMYNTQQTDFDDDNIDWGAVFGGDNANNYSARGGPINAGIGARIGAGGPVGAGGATAGATVGALPPARCSSARC